MIASKLTSKAQATIPQPVRLALDLPEGDELLYRVEGQRDLCGARCRMSAIKEKMVEVIRNQPDDAS